MKITYAIILILLVFTPPMKSYAADASAMTNYKVYCIQCHGTKGTGKGINTHSMNVQPRDHTDAKGMSAISDAQLKKAIKEGGLSVSKSVLMPPWKATFTDVEIDALVKYLRELCKCSGGS